jgi:membrane associated rhomboid family serine protease
VSLSFGIEPGLTTGIMVANVILWLLLQSNHALLERMVFVNRSVARDREYDRLIASGFAHHSFIHLLFNMMTLYYFGPTVEMLYGSLGFAAIYLSSIIGGNLFTMVTHRNNPNYSALGASGGLFGVVFAFVWLLPDAKLALFIIPVFIPGWLFAVIVCWISMILSQLPRAGEAGISHEGHLGGAVTGALVALFFHIPENMRTEQVVFLAGAILPVILFGIWKWLKPVRMR